MERKYSLTDDQIKELIIVYNEMMYYREQREGITITEKFKNAIEDAPYITRAVIKEQDISKKYKTLTDFYDNLEDALRDMKDNNKKDKAEYEKIAQWCNMVAHICDNKSKE